MIYIRFFRARLGTFPWLKRPLLWLSLANVVLGATAIAFAYASKLALDDVLDGRQDRLIYSGGLLVGLILVQLVCKTGTRLYQASTQAVTHQRLQGYFTTELLRRKLPDIQSRHTGAWMNRLDSDVTRVASGMLDVPPRFVFMMFRFVLAFVLLVVLDVYVALSLAVLGVVLLGFSVLLRPEMRRRHERRQEAESDVRSFLQEQLDHVPIIKAYDAEAFTLALLGERQGTYAKAQIHQQRFAIWTSTGLQAMFMLVYALVLLLGAYRITLGALSVGGLVAILQLAEYMQSPFRIAGNLLPMYYATETSYDRLAALEALPLEDAERRTSGSFDRIVARELSFAYGDKPVIQALSFDIAAGDVVRVEGDSGVGKTTLLYLLLGLLEPQSGALELQQNGSVLMIGPASRSLFAYVPQQIRIVSGTIRENLVYHRQGIDDKRLRQVCAIADIDRDIDALPDGFETTIGERGLGLSEGQLQRLAIARALLSDAPVLLLDEATSALDATSEAKILNRLMHDKGKTVILVSHRTLSEELLDQTLYIG